MIRTRGSQVQRADSEPRRRALGGTLTTWAGSIEVRSPLRDVVFEKGVLRFTARLQGSDYRFRGTVESSRLTGSIEREGKPPLSFTMDYLD